MFMQFVFNGAEDSEPALKSGLITSFVAQKWLIIMFFLWRNPHAATESRRSHSLLSVVNSDFDSCRQRLPSDQNKLWNSAERFRSRWRRRWCNRDNHPLFTWSRNQYQTAALSSLIKSEQNHPSVWCRATVTAPSPDRLVLPDSKLHHLVQRLRQTGRLHWHSAAASLHPDTQIKVQPAAGCSSVHQKFNNRHQPAAAYAPLPTTRLTYFKNVNFLRGSAEVSVHMLITAVNLLVKGSESCSACRRS